MHFTESLASCSLISDDTSGAVVDSFPRQQKQYSAPQPQVTTLSQSSGSSSLQVHKLEPAQVSENVQFSQPQLIDSSQGNPDAPTFLSLSEPQFVGASQPQFIGTSQPQIIGSSQNQYSGGSQQQFVGGSLQQFGGDFQQQSIGNFQQQFSVISDDSDESIENFQGNSIGTGAQIFPAILEGQSPTENVVGQPLFLGQSFGQSQAGSVSFSDPQVVSVSQPQVLSVSQPPSFG